MVAASLAGGPLRRVVCFEDSRSSASASATAGRRTLAAGFDALENICLLLTIGGAGAALPLLTTIFAACKFALLAAAIAYLLAGLLKWLGNRRGATRTS